MTIFESPDLVDRLVRFMCAEVAKLRSGVSWASLSEDALWAELVSCILGSRVRWEASLAATQRLGALGLLCVGPMADFDSYEVAVTRALATSASRSEAYRFSRRRGKAIRLSAERLYGCGQSLKGLLSASTDSRIVRRELICRLNGIGPKQSSMFLRNVGFTDELAVLDVHTIRFVQLRHICETQGRNMSSPRVYEHVEDALRQYAVGLGYPVGCLDTAIWVVMRAATKGGLV